MEVRPTNGVSYGLKYTVTSADASAGYVVFDFRKDVNEAYRYDLVASVLVLDTSGAPTTVVGFKITYPSDGVVKVEGTLVATTVINLVAQRANPTV